MQVAARSFHYSDHSLQGALESECGARSACQLREAEATES